MDCKQYRQRNKLTIMQEYKQIKDVFCKGNFAVFPIIISEKSANHPDFGKVKVVSGAKMKDGRWHYQDHYNLDENNPRWEKEHWLPILSAWETSLSKLVEMKKTKILVTL